jgi:hypothetical protein
MLSPLIKQEIALAQDNIHNLIRLGQISSSWRSVCNSDRVWKKHHQGRYQLAPAYKESTLLYQGFSFTHKYLYYVLPNGHTLSLSQILREYNIVEHRLFMLCKTNCSVRTHCVRRECDASLSHCVSLKHKALQTNYISREGGRIIFYYSITSAFMDREEFLDFLYSFSTFTPLLTKEPLPLDYNIIAYKVMQSLYVLLLALFMSPLLFALLYLFSRLY